MDEKELSKLAKSGKADLFKEAYMKIFSNATEEMAGSAFNYYKLINLESDVSGFFGKDSPFSKVLNIGNDLIKSSFDISGQLFESQLGKQNEDADAIKIIEMLKNNGIANLGVDLTLETAMLMKDELIKQLKIESELYSEIATKTGLIGELGDALNKDIRAASVETARYGITLKDIGDFYVSLVENSGRLIQTNRQLFEDVAPLVNVLDISLKDFSKTITDFEKVGIGADKTISSLREVTTRSLSYGLSAKEIGEGIIENISRLNEYGFNNGVDGLETMIRRSKEFRFSMDEVFKVADKVFDPTSAIDFVANMQVLGGAIGDLNDPLKLMYMSTNDIEGLQEAIIGAANSLATYNEAQGRFEITGANLRLAKAQADTLGMSYKEFSNLAIASAERTQAAFELAGRGLNIDDDEIEFLTNLAKMEDGEMKITIPESLAKELSLPMEISMNQMTDNIKDQLIANKEAFEDITVEEMAMKQLTETQQMSRGINVIASYFRVRGAEMLKGTGDAVFGDLFGDLKESIINYSNQIDSTKSYVDREKKESSVRGDIKSAYDTAEPIVNMFNDTVDLLKDVVSENNTKTVNHVHTHTMYIKSEPFADAISRTVAKNPESFFDLTRIDSRDYLATNG